jgi:hypothetical protein
VLERHAGNFWTALMPELEVFGMGDDPGGAVSDLEEKVVEVARRVFADLEPGSEQLAARVLRQRDAQVLGQILDRSARYWAPEPVA